MKHLKEYNIREVIEYFESHSENETVNHFNTSKSTLYRILKKYNYKKPKELCIKLRQETISKDSLHWQKRNKKTIQTNLEKYGETSFTKTLEYIEKTKQTNLEKYGSEWFLTSECGIKAKKDFAKSLGVDNIFQAKEIKEKIKQTNLQRYGVENVSSNTNIKEKKARTWANNSINNKHHYRCYVYNNIYFDSFPELAFYLKMLNDKVDIQRCTEKISYYFNGQKHLYLPDFKIGNKIIEIKSRYLYNAMLIDGTIENSKLKCMIEHNVDLKLTDSIEISNCIKWFNINYKKEDFKVIKEKN